MRSRSYRTKVRRLVGCTFLAALGVAFAPAFEALADEGEKQPKFPPFNVLLKDAESVPTDPAARPLFKLFKKGQNLYAELGPGVFNQDLIVCASIARGVGYGDVLGGMSLNFGNDWLWQFRRTDDDKINIVRRNIRFTAKSGSPESDAVKLAYTDSILFNLPIATMGPSGGPVVDLTPVFMSDLAGVGGGLPGFGFVPSRSSWASVKAFDENVEIQVAATFAGGGYSELDSVPDGRTATVHIHYSLSKLPQTGYQPRVADDRVGYFLTVLKDYSKSGEEDRFVRYINRWDLRKKDSGLSVSPPVKPIVFHLEKTIPIKYRQPIREGILEWNKAFDKLGFYNAVEVRQQEESDTWDPEDVRYNTFRWITSGAGFAMGPSRVNPLTGQILDADIIFDSDFIEFWRDDYETFTPKSIAAMTGGPLDLASYQAQMKQAGHHEHSLLCRCELHSGRSRDFALGATVLATRKFSEEEVEKMIMQGLKEVTMHEVGHTLGLRHNFKASSTISLDDANDTEKTKDKGLTSSVMDYAPANLMPKDSKQGDFYSQTLGPYDYWAIDYGYTTKNDPAELKKIAARSGEPDLVYATDEDTRGIDPDPLTNRWDLGSDPLAFAKARTKLVSELWDGLVDRVVKDGEGYQKARRAFGVLLSSHGQACYMASRYIGGIYVTRSHKGDKDAKAPFVVVDPAKQREAMALLEEQVFSDKPFKLPPELYNQLSSTRWSHWGSYVPMRPDLAVHEVITLWQDRILQQLLSSLTLERLHDSELRVPADQDAFTTAELLERLTKAVFAEVDNLPEADYTPRKPAISSLRRNLQRAYLQRMGDMAMGDTSAPEDCQTVAYAELASLETRINKLLEKNTKLDAYSKAHLTETASRIHKILDAKMQLGGGGGGLQFLILGQPTGEQAKPQRP